ncbi:hypothetical protein AAKU67_003130 [Oxalobacteraceae bacterium GrIS 2.11]
MSSIAEIYTEAIHSNLKPLYGNWPPDQPLQLGDYGVLRDSTFIRLANIGDAGLAIKFSKLQSGSKNQEYFTSKEGVEVSFNAKGDGPVPSGVKANASMSISFSNSEAVFFNAAGCEFWTISDKNALAKAIMALYGRGNGLWKREWVVVTDLIKTGSATVVVSGGDSSAITLEAAANVTAIDLANVDLKLSLAHEKSIGYRIISDQSGLTPLMGLSQIQGDWNPFHDPAFTPRSYALMDKRISRVIEEAPEIKTEQSPDELRFRHLN